MADGGNNPDMKEIDVEGLSRQAKVLNTLPEAIEAQKRINKLTQVEIDMAEAKAARMQEARTSRGIPMTIGKTREERKETLPKKNFWESTTRLKGESGSEPRTMSLRQQMEKRKEERKETLPSQNTWEKRQQKSAPTDTKQ
jgi:hypothetical protein